MGKYTEENIIENVEILLKKVNGIISELNYEVRLSIDNDYRSNYPYALVYGERQALLYLDANVKYEDVFKEVLKCVIEDSYKQGQENVKKGM